MKVKVYEWLRGDGNCVIDTNIKEDALSIKSSVKTYIHGVRQCIISAYSSNYITDISVEISGHWTSPNDGFRVWCGGSSDVTSNPLVIGEVYDFEIVAKNNTTNVEVLNNGNVHAKHTQSYTGHIHRPIRLFNDYRYEINSPFGNQDLAIGKTIINDHILVPCLTESNEACMIDLLTGDLYKNQGSSSFSVEGEMLYEFETPSINRVMKKPKVVVRLREWLRGRGDTFIDTNIIDINVVSVPFKPYINNVRQCILSSYSEEYGNFGLALELRDQANGNSIRLWNGQKPDYSTPIKVDVGTEYKWDIIDYNKQIGVLSKDGEEVFRYYPLTKPTFLNKTRLFADYRTGVFNKQDLALGVTTINSTTFHPCDILLHPTLPPQSCMIDLKTGDLYTNQGTGNFTCEGADLGIWSDTMAQTINNKVDDAMMVVCKNNGMAKVVYEKVQPWIEHKWLCNSAEGRAVIDTRLYPSLDMRIKGKVYYGLWEYFTSFGRPDIAGAYGNNRFYPCCQWYEGQMRCTLGNDNGFNIATTGVFDFDFNNKGISTINGISKTMTTGLYQDPPQTDASTLWLCGVNELSVSQSADWINANFFYNQTLRTGEIRIISNESGTEILHLTPIQLTRSLLPSEIASSNTALRGECGFADKEKYKAGLPWFYGSIAKQGKFGVSDE